MKKLMALRVDWDEYERRCQANLKAIESDGTKLSDEDKEKLGIMVYRQLTAEIRAKDA